MALSPDRIRRRDLDCVVRVDKQKLIEDGAKLYLSAAGVVLIDVPISVE